MKILKNIIIWVIKLAKGKSGNTGKIVVGVVIGIIVAIGATQFSDFSSKPNMIGTTQATTTSLCPADLNFGWEFTKFKLIFSNHGEDDGSFLVSLTSDDVLSRYENSGNEYSQSSEHIWYAGIEKDIPFVFELKRHDDQDIPETIDVSVDARCLTVFADFINIPCGDREFTCNYKLNEDSKEKIHYEFQS